MLSLVTSLILFSNEVSITLFFIFNIYLDFLRSFLLDYEKAIEMQIDETYQQENLFLMKNNLKSPLEFLTFVHMWNLFTMNAVVTLRKYSFGKASISILIKEFLDSWNIFNFYEFMEKKAESEIEAEFEQAEDILASLKVILIKIFEIFFVNSIVFFRLSDVDVSRFDIFGFFLC